MWIKTQFGTAVNLAVAADLDTVAVAGRTDLRNIDLVTEPFAVIAGSKIIKGVATKEAGASLIARILEAQRSDLHGVFVPS